jgi:Universal stress protein family
VVFNKIKKFLKRQAEPAKPPEVEVKRRHHLQDDYDQTMMAATFAEAGAKDLALEALRSYGKRKILVVSQGEAMSEGVAEYATALAERLGYELIALNVGAGPGGEAVSAYQEHMQEEFRGRAAKAASVLEQKAAARQVPLTHVVKFGEVGAAVDAINREYRRIEMVLSDSRIQPEELPARVNLPVFSLKPHQ